MDTAICVASIRIGKSNLQGYWPATNQPKVINGENRIVVNSKATKLVKVIWGLWNAQDASSRRA